MRWFDYVVIASVALMCALVIFSGWLVAVSQPQQAHAQQKNAYWPYSVETSVKDR